MGPMDLKAGCNFFFSKNGFFTEVATWDPWYGSEEVPPMYVYYSHYESSISHVKNSF